MSSRARRASGRYRDAALETFALVLAFAREPARLGRPQLAGQPPAQELAVPMILLNLIGELRGEPGSATFDDRDDWDELERDAVVQVLEHFDRARKELREVVAPGGARLDSPAGRLLNPGHAIECGWFLLDHARRTGDATLRDDALLVVEGALERGWDAEHGGLFAFLDAEGHSPVQLEWSLKLWWPHCEALLATLHAWRATGDVRWFDEFERVADWTFAHFPDPHHGEWYGYLDRQGHVSQRFKGGPYKGCFHVPRALWLGAGLLR